MSKNTLFMETTKINPERTVAEIQSVLREYGAESILVDYENKKVKAISFKITIAGNPIPFLLPCRWEFIYELLKRKKGYGNEAIKEQAERVGWRQILRWVEAQLALTDTGMVQIQEVFMPYMQSNTGETLYQCLEKNSFNALEYKK